MELKKYTRKIAREHNEIILKNAVVGMWENANSTLDPTQIGKGNDYLVMSLAWKTQNEIDEMEVEEYENILKAINEKTKRKEEKKKK